jgi:aminoglycoside phosphotransferase (APT) family kinase protein
MNETPTATKVESSRSGDADFDPKRLDAFLRGAVPALQGAMSLDRISGGQSNPTYFVTYANRRMVLRKQPGGIVLPSAHAVDREYRVMNALADTNVPVPRMILYCEDRSIIGTRFYLMERLEGRVFPDCSLPGVNPADRHAMYLRMAETLARLHNVEWQKAGLTDYGKAGNYFARQISRWTQQWQLSKTRDLPALERVIAWLPLNVPDDEATTIAHGDFRIGNLMFHPTQPHVVGVLDWELSTLGHPLADVAYSALAWRLLPSEYMGMRGLDQTSLGIPSEADYLAHYYRHANRPLRVQPFHFVFALFRLAVIFEGIAARARSGVAASENAAEVGALSSTFAERALEIIDRGSSIT